MPDLTDLAIRRKTGLQALAITLGLAVVFSVLSWSVHRRAADSRAADANRAARDILHEADQAVRRLGGVP